MFEIKKEIKWLKEKIKNKKVFAIPKNGLIIAALANLNIVSTPEEAEIIFDDIIDSGRTIEKYKDFKKPIITLYVKSYTPEKDKIIFYKEEKDWVEFWWEDDEKEVKEIITRQIEFLGENPRRQGLRETPLRVVKSWKKLFEGYKKKMKVTVFDNESKIDQIVGLNNIEFFSTCEHHLLPFFGKAHIYYIPDKKIIGISKLARILDLYSRRMQNQERIAKQVADFIEKELSPKGVAVVIEAQHFCMIARGVEKQNAIMKTSDLRGVFRDNKNQARQELFNLIK